MSKRVSLCSRSLVGYLSSAKPSLTQSSLQLLLVDHWNFRDFSTEKDPIFVVGNLDVRCCEI